MNPLNGRSWRIAGRMLRQNRWLLALLGLWPFAMAAILLVPRGRIAAGDVTAILQQECFYGLALVAFSGSAQFGNEQRSRRVVEVLARAVSRSEYLLALAVAAWLPLAIYVASFVVSGALLAQAARMPLAPVMAMAVAQLVLGLWIAAMSVFFAVWMPALLASSATIAAAAAAVFAGWFPAGRLLLRMAAGTMDHGWNAGGLLSAVAAAAVFLVAAGVVFSRRDLNLTAG